MSLFDAFSYQGKRVLVVGAATGMGAATAQVARDAGATVVGMDVATVAIDGVQAVKVNLADTASIDAALAEAGGTFDVLFSCAGVADGVPGIEKINFLGHRYMIEQMIAKGMLGRGSAIGMISSAAGLAWDAKDVLPEVLEYLAITDIDEASAFAIANGKADYMWSKRAINGYVASKACELMKQGIRINAICPGPTDTPLAQANADVWLAFGSDYRGDVGVNASTPLEQAYPLVFLCSDAASVITGITMITDSGYMSSGLTGSYPAATPVAAFLMGRM